jgi:MoaA/NifB/PqqE/SkfB family radical SAM enzyme
MNGGMNVRDMPPEEKRKASGQFFEGGITRLAASALTKHSPAYVQFYVTARCNLACEQCNVIYANADQEECTTDQAKAIAENLAKIGTSVVLLTGGEPFVRKDLGEIAAAMIANGIHPRFQTNGLATRQRLEEMVKVGAQDISISLDSVLPDVQDTINGGMESSWERAIRTISNVNEVWPEQSFCALGCVLAPRNIDHIESVIRFATAIGWWVSLVPAHQTSLTEPRSFSTFDSSLKFKPEDYPRVKAVLERVKYLRDVEKLNIYDSDEYLDDIYRFVTGQPLLWRRRNGGVCDSPNLYFAIQPNGDMAVCCDYRMPKSYPVFAPEFPDWYRSERLQDDAHRIASRCSGCMYGSFPEITISARYFIPMIHRARLFLLDGTKRKLQKLSAESMMELARDIASDAGLVAG